jgi:hypothetical protein
MNPQDTPNPPVEPTINNPLAAMEPGEQVICEIKRHPIGIIGIYVGVSFLLLVLAVVAFIVAPNVITSYGRSQIILIGGLVFVIAGAVSTGFLFIASKIYWGNSWVVTSDSITQISRISLFDKQTSQLSLADLEDITAEQDGVLAQMFHFGVLSAETAAATDKFTFLYCPNPTIYARQILQARERFEQAHRPKAAQPPVASTRDLGVAATELAQDAAAQSSATTSDQRP